MRSLDLMRLPCRKGPAEAGTTNPGSLTQRPGFQLPPPDDGKPSAWWGTSSSQPRRQLDGPSRLMGLLQVAVAAQVQCAGATPCMAAGGGAGRRQ